MKKKVIELTNEDLQEIWSRLSAVEGTVCRLDSSYFNPNEIVVENPRLGGVREKKYRDNILKEAHKHMNTPGIHNEEEKSGGK